MLKEDEIAHRNRTMTNKYRIERMVVSLPVPNFQDECNGNVQVTIMESKVKTGELKGHYYFSIKLV